MQLPVRRNKRRCRRRTATLACNSAGRLSTITDRKGNQTRLAYNERGQIATVSKSDREVSYQYDAVGRLTEVRDPTSVNRYTYDAGDRLTQTDSTTAAGSHRLAYQYDSLNRISDFCSGKDCKNPFPDK